MAIKSLQGDRERQYGIHYEFDPDQPPLGEGGMGIVYLGVRVFENSGVKNYVAIKQLRDNAKPEVYQRAQREASIRIKHENLVEMLGFITTHENDPFDGNITRHYVVSEYLHGVLLSDVLSGKCDDVYGHEVPAVKTLCQRLETDRVGASVDILRSVLSGILILHDKGFIHRDIDPSNIMVTSGNHIKLIDFGIAKEVSSLSVSDKLLTVSGEFVGKPEYAAPELVLGDIRNQGFHTDIYAIGILLYQLLTGHLPFEGSRYEIFQMQLKKRIPSKDISHPGLRKVIVKAVAKDKAKRYNSAAEFRANLDKSMLNENVWGSALIKVVTIFIALLIVLFTSFHLEDWIHKIEINVHKDAWKKTDHTLIKEQNSIRESFDEAMLKINSGNKEYIVEGYMMLKHMADSNKYMPAMNIIGLVSFPKIELLENNAVSRLTLIRDATGLDRITDESCYESVVRYLSSSASDDVLSNYILGYSLWRLKRFSEGETALQIAKDNFEASDVKEVSYKEVCHRLKLCQDAE